LQDKTLDTMRPGHRLAPFREAARPRAEFLF
jgi:hypothetical protein